MIKTGLYKHYKGGIYYVTGVATHSETLEKMVTYIHIGVVEGSLYWVRPLAMFTENVEVSGVIKPRFAYIGDEVPGVIAKFYDPLSGYTGADRVD